MIWNKGKAVVQAALGRRELQKITGSAASGQPWIDEATTKLASARMLAPADPKDAFIVGYDALPDQIPPWKDRVLHSMSSMKNPLRRKNQLPPASEADLAADDVIEDSFETKDRDAARPGWPGFGMTAVSSFVTPAREDDTR